MTYTFLFYKEADGRWYFDDASKNIVHEEMVEGIPDILNFYKKSNSNTLKVKITDIKPKDKRHSILVYLGEEGGGVVYGLFERDAVYEAGWLCPTFWKYFNQPAPEYLYFKVI